MTRVTMPLVSRILMQLGFVLAVGAASAQAVGIRFERGLTWPEVQAKAEQENKLIFLTWPAPR